MVEKMRNKVYNGNCLDIMKEYPDNCVDMVLTSPPYDDMRSYNNTLEWCANVWEPIIKELYRILKNGGVVVWVVGDATIDGSETGSSFRQALHAIDCGFNLHDTMIYQKTGASTPGAFKIRYYQIFEYMFVFSKGIPKTFNPIKDRENKTYGKKVGGSVRKKDCTLKEKSCKGRPVERYGVRDNIWIFNQNAAIKINHPAIFPEQLAYDHIISWSNKGDLILDPFAGSGTTGKIAKYLERDYVLIERNSEYLDVINRRLCEDVNIKKHVKSPKQKSVFELLKGK